MNEYDIDRLSWLIKNSTPRPWGKHSFGQYDDRRRNCALTSPDGKDVATVWRVSNCCISGHQYKDDEFLLFLANHAEEILVALKERDQYREALEKYADKENWGYIDGSGCPKGIGSYEEACFLGPQVAKQALEPPKDKP